MVRPHPAVWRIVHGMIIIYLLALVFLLFQNVGDARQLLKVSTPTGNTIFRAPAHPDGFSSEGSSTSDLLAS